MQYILDAKKNPVPCPDMRTWGLYMTEENIRVKLDKIGRKTVSTVFLGVDHGWYGKLALFETMVFDPETTGWLDEVCERYATWDEAVAGHEYIVREVIASQGKLSIGRMLGIEPK